MFYSSFKTTLNWHNQGYKNSVPGWFKAKLKKNFLKKVVKKLNV